MESAAKHTDWRKITVAGFRDVYTGGVVEFAIGEFWHSETTISMDVHSGPYDPDLLGFVEEEGLLEPSPDFDIVVGRFLRREWVR